MASACSSRYCRRLRAASSSSPCRSRSRSRAAAGEAWRTSRTNSPTARPSSSGRPGPSPCQNGIFPGWPGAGVTIDPIVGDVLDAPRRRAEQERLARPRLVDHLLVELADPGAVGQEHPEQAPVGDGAGVGHGQALGARPAPQDAGDPVPHDARPQLAELLGRVAAGEQVEGGGEGLVGELGEVGGPPHEGGDVVERPLLAGRPCEGDHGDDLLGQHVEGVAGVAGALDQPLVHAVDDHRGLDEIGAVLGEQLAPARRADLVAGPADALEAGGDRAGRLDLHDEVDRAHVDAELEARRAHERLSRPDLSSSSIWSRRSRDSDPWWAFTSSTLGRRRTRSPCRADAVVGVRSRPRARELVEAGGEPLGQAAGVDEDQRRPVRLDQLEQPRVHRRPDRPPHGPPAAGPDTGSSTNCPGSPMSSIGHDDLDVERLAHAGVDDGDVAVGDRPRTRRGTGRSPRAGAGWPTGRCAAAAGCRRRAHEVRRAARG